MSEYFKVLDQGVGYQVRMSISVFDDVEYLHVREYYQDFDGEWLPTKRGIHFTLSLENTRNLLEGILEILSLAESKELISEFFGDILNEAAHKTISRQSE